MNHHTPLTISNQVVNSTNTYPTFKVEYPIRIKSGLLGLTYCSLYSKIFQIPIFGVLFLDLLHEHELSFNTK